MEQVALCDSTGISGKLSGKMHLARIAPGYCPVGLVSGDLPL